MARGDGHIVVLPPSQIPGLPQVVVKRVGVLDETGISRALCEADHAVSSAEIIPEKSSAFNDAPPTKAPSTLDTAKISAAFEGLTEPP